jgi:hypothetical protein
MGGGRVKMRMGGLELCLYGLLLTPRIVYTRRIGWICVNVGAGAKHAGGDFCGAMRAGLSTTEGGAAAFTERVCGGRRPDQKRTPR